ncbi:MAG TPA: hypothetical protein VGT78_01130 [Rhizomicrobium sp.]|nr:hypothetical protein [Rhizomicrobium sp.]
MDTQHARPDITALLMQKYGLLKQEVSLHGQNYEHHINYLQFSVAGLVAALVFLFGTGASQFGNALGIPLKDVFAIFAFLITTVSFLLTFKVLETSYRLVLVATRMSIIEDSINKRLGEKILVWESLLAEKFSTTEGALHLKNPSVFMALYHIVLITSAAVLLPTYLYVLAWNGKGDGGPFLGWFILFGAAYTLFSAAVTAYVGFSTFGPIRHELKSKMLAIIASASNTESVTPKAPTGQPHH